MSDLPDSEYDAVGWLRAYVDPKRWNPNGDYRLFGSLYLSDLRNVLYAIESGTFYGPVDRERMRGGAVPDRDGRDMTPTPRDTPDRIFWCHICQSGIGVWGGPGTPPPRCPACRQGNIEAVAFEPRVES